MSADTTRVNFVKEDGAGLAQWHITGRPEEGDTVRTSYGPEGLWRVVRVEWTGNQQARCVCVLVPEEKR